MVIRDRERGVGANGEILFDGSTVSILQAARNPFHGNVNTLNRAELDVKKWLRW